MLDFSNIVGKYDYVVIFYTIDNQIYRRYTKWIEFIFKVNTFFMNIKGLIVKKR
jgi:hypothetical protein